MVKERGGKVHFWIDWIWIERQYRRQGFATATLRILEQEARKLGADRTGLTVRTDNPGAVALYSKLGYANERMQMTKLLDQDPHQQLRNRVSVRELSRVSATAGLKRDACGRWGTAISARGERGERETRTYRSTKRDTFHEFHTEVIPDSLSGANHMLVKFEGAGPPTLMLPSYAVPFGYVTVTERSWNPGVGGAKRWNVNPHSV